MKKHAFFPHQYMSLYDWGLCIEYHIDGLVQDYMLSSALAMEIPQSCTEPLIWYWCLKYWEGIYLCTITQIIMTDILIICVYSLLNSLTWCGRYFIDNICKCFFVNDNILIQNSYLIKCIPYDLFNNLEFRWWLGTEQVTSHCLTWWWQSVLTQICVTSHQKVRWLK